MTTTADYLSQLQQEKTDLANNLIAKGVQANTTETFTTLVPKVLEIPTGKKEGELIKFIDYDGTLLETWTLDELQTKTKDDFPNPEHEGLTLRGWNWGPVGLKNNNGAMTVGPTYYTTDGKDHLYITFPQGTIDRNITLKLSALATDAISGTIEWGDGNNETFSITPPEGHNTFYPQTFTHTYTENTDYIVKIKVNEEVGYALGGDSEAPDVISPENRLTKIEASKFCIAGYGPSWQFMLDTISNSGQTFTWVQMPNAGMKAFVVPNSVQDLTKAFQYCRGLESVSLPNTITKIGNYGFFMTYKLKELDIPNGVTTIGNNAFGQSGIEKLTLPDTITTIGEYAFSQCKSLAEIKLPTNLTTLGAGCFNECVLLKQIEMPDSISVIGNETFKGCALLQQIHLPNLLETIGEYAFSGCYLQHIEFSAALQTIGAHAFENNIFLQTIDLPSLVTTIGDYAFMGCEKLEQITIGNPTPPTLGENAFTNIAVEYKIYVPYSEDHSIQDAYKLAWTNYADNIFELNEDGTVPQN